MRIIERDVDGQVQLEFKGASYAAVMAELTEQGWVAGRAQPQCNFTVTGIATQGERLSRWIVTAVPFIDDPQVGEHQADAK